MRRLLLAVVLVPLLVTPAAEARSYYRDWLQEPLFAMTVQIADATSSYDSASANGIGCKQVNRRWRLARCRYAVKWDDYELGGGSCELVVYVRPRRYRFSARQGSCPRKWQLPRGYHRVDTVEF